MPWKYHISIPCTIHASHDFAVSVDNSSGLIDTLTNYYELCLKRKYVLMFSCFTLDGRLQMHQVKWGVNKNAALWGYHCRHWMCVDVEKMKHDVWNEVMYSVCTHPGVINVSSGERSVTVHTHHHKQTTCKAKLNCKFTSKYTSKFNNKLINQLTSKLIFT